MPQAFNDSRKIDGPGDQVFRYQDTRTTSGTIGAMGTDHHLSRGLDLGFARISMTKPSLERQLEQ